MTKFAKLALLSVFLALPSGCCHNLQAPFVDAMDATMIAIELDVKHGLYEPDAMSSQTLLRAKSAIADAQAVLAAEAAAEGE